MKVQSFCLAFECDVPEEQGSFKSTVVPLTQSW